MGYDLNTGMAGAGTGAAIGTAFMPGIGTAVGAGVGAGMGFLGGKKGPDYSNITRLYNERATQIGAFAQSLASARAKYLTSLNNMYNNAYARFSGTAEAGFANRGMSVSGGAFASALARKAAEYQDAGDVAAVGMEREDLGRIDQAYGANTGAYMGAISGGPGATFAADREDMRALGGFAGKLAMMKYGNKLSGDSGDFGSDGTYWAQNTHGGYDKLGLGPSYRS